MKSALKRIWNNLPKLLGSIGFFYLDFYFFIKDIVDTLIFMI